MCLAGWEKLPDVTETECLGQNKNKNKRVGGKKVLSKNMFSCQEQTLTTLKAQIYFPKTMQKQQDLIKILERSMPL